MKVVQMEVIIAADNDMVEETTAHDITKALRHAYYNYFKTVTPGTHIKPQIRIFSVDHVE